MTLQFLRHADAEPFTGSDFSRNLTPKGNEQAAKVGKFLKSRKLAPDIILTSPLVRARQTADIVGKAVGVEPVVLECLACGMDLDSLFKELHAHSGCETVLVAGHEPDFSRAISRLLEMPDPVLVNVRKASLTGLEIIAWGNPAGRLLYSIPAELM